MGLQEVTLLEPIMDVLKVIGYILGGVIWVALKLVIGAVYVLLIPFMILGKLLKPIVNGWKMIWNLIKAIKNGTASLGDVLKVAFYPIYLAIQAFKKVLEFLGLIDKEEEKADKRKEKSQQRQMSLRPSQPMMASRTVNNNNSVNITPSGSLSAGDAPRVGSVMTSMLSNGARGA